MTPFRSRRRSACGPRLPERRRSRTRAGGIRYARRAQGGGASPAYVRFQSDDRPLRALGTSVSRRLAAVYQKSPEISGRDALALDETKLRTIVSGNLGIRTSPLVRIATLV